MDIYDKIDATLKDKHMSRRQLAIAAGIPESSLAAAFARRSKMNPENIEKIAKTLEISPAELIPQFKILDAYAEEKQQFVRIIDEQINHLNFQANLRDEFVKNNILEKIRKHENLDRLYSVLASAFTLNADGLDKAIQYLIDLNKIYDYRETGVRLTARHIDMINQEEVTQCPEDAQQTDQACSPGSDQTGAGNADIKPE